MAEIKEMQELLLNRFIVVTGIHDGKKDKGFCVDVFPVPNEENNFNVQLSNGIIYGLSPRMISLDHVVDRTGRKFSINREIESTFRFHSNPANGMVWISVVFNCYDRTIPFILALEEMLKRKIPFRYKKNTETQVRVLSGEYRKGMLSVEMNIGYEISDEKAKEQLEGKGFSLGFDPS